MSPASPKRRKLDHGGADNNSNFSGSDEEMEDDAPNTTAKQTHAKPHHARDIDESAVYAGGLFKSNTFKIQVDYLLEEIRPYYEGRLGKANETLSKLKGLIEGIEPRPELPVSILGILVRRLHC